MKVLPAERPEGMPLPGYLKKRTYDIMDELKERLDELTDKVLELTKTRETVFMPEELFRYIKALANLKPKLFAGVQFTESTHAGNTQFRIEFW